MVESERGMRVRGGNPKSGWWKDQVKAAVKRKEAAWKDVLGARDEDEKERCLEIYKKKRARIKGVYIKARRRFMNSLEAR